MRRDALWHPIRRVSVHNEDTQDRVNVLQQGHESQNVSFTSESFTRETKRTKCKVASRLHPAWRKLERLDCKHCSLNLEYSTFLLCSQSVSGAPHENTDHTQTYSMYTTESHSLICVQIHKGFDLKTTKFTGTKKLMLYVYQKQSRWTPTQRSSLTLSTIICARKRVSGSEKSTSVFFAWNYFELVIFKHVGFLDWRTA